MYEVFEDLRKTAGTTYSVLIPGHDRDVLTRFAQCAGLPEGEAVSIGQPQLKGN